jgi:preprotein translocase SecF subunit
LLVLDFKHAFGSIHTQTILDKGHAIPELSGAISLLFGHPGKKAIYESINGGKIELLSERGFDQGGALSMPLFCTCTSEALKGVEANMPDSLLHVRFADDMTNADRAKSVFAALKADSTTPGASQAELRRVEFVGPQIGEELATDGALALLFVIIGIVIYLAIRFEWKFAVAAIVANLHDVVIILGFFAAFGWEFSLTVLAAVLAVLGYSVNESVVIFDRIRETFRRKRGMSTREVIDHAITSTISRTIITHGCTEMMVVSMLIFGGPTLFHFALALTIGILFGIYSSVFVAAAVAMWLGLKREDLIKPIKKRDDGQPELP